MKRNLLFSIFVITFISILLFISPNSANAARFASSNEAIFPDKQDAQLTDSGMDTLMPEENPTIDTPIQSIPSDLYRKATPLQVSKTTKRVKSVTGGSDYLLFLESGEDADSLPLGNMEYANALVTLEGEGRGALFPIKYDLSSLDTSVIGIQILRGTVIVPDYYEIPRGMEEVVIPVAVYNGQNPFELPVTGVIGKLEPHYPLASAAGTPREHIQKSLLSLNKTAYYEVSGQYICPVDLTWDCGGIDTYIPGTYEVTAGISLPDGILFPDSIKLPYSIIDVQDPDKLTLSTPAFNYHNGFINICWVKNTPLKDLFRLWYKIGDGPWREDIDEDLMSLSENYDGVCQTLRIFSANLEKNVPYYFNLEYDGEISNILTITNTPGKFIYNNIEGDRDGGDSKPQEPPNIIQTQPETSPDHISSGTVLPQESFQTKPYSQAAGSGSGKTSAPFSQKNVPTVPETPVSTEPSGRATNVETKSVSTASGASRRDHKNHGNTNTAETAAMYAAKGGSRNRIPGVFITAGHPVPEEDASDYTVWSGYRILKLMETNPDQPLVFEKHGIRMEFPTDSEILACVSENSSLRVELRLLEENRIYTDISMDGIPPANLPDLTVSLPWHTSEGEGPWTAEFEDGTAVNALFIPEKHCLQFTTNTTGIITIHGSLAPGAQSPESGTSALLAGCCAAVILTALLWTCRICRRNKV